MTYSLSPRVAALAALSAAAMTWAPAAQAQVSTFSDQASWNAATSDAVNRDFNSYNGTFGALNGVNDHGVTFSASNGYQFSRGPVSCGTACIYGADFGTGNYVLGTAWPNTMTASLSTPSNAFSIDLGLDAGGKPSYLFPFDVSVTVDFASGSSATYTTAVPTAYNQWGFFGITSATDAITSVTFGPPNLYPQYYCDPQVCSNGLSGPNLQFDNFATANVRAVPEPVSWALMLGGFGLIGGALRSRRRNAVSIG